MPGRPGLDRAAVVEAAAALADEQGLEQITLSEVAARLGVRTPSLYNHIAGLPGLRRDLALLAMRELTGCLTRATVGLSKDDAVRALAGAYRAYAQEHPGRYAASLHAPEREDAELTAASDDLLAVVLAVLAPYGRRGDDALHTIRALRSLAHGFVSLEAAGGFGLPLAIDESFQRLVDMLIWSLRREPVSP